MLDEFPMLRTLSGKNLLTVILPIFLILLTLISVSGLAVGAVLHWNIPAISYEMAALIGVVASSGAGHLYLIMSQAVKDHSLEKSLADSEQIMLTPIRPPRSSRAHRHRTEE